jgi:hypothetical protein
MRDSEGNYCCVLFGCRARKIKGDPLIQKKITLNMCRLHTCVSNNPYFMILIIVHYSEGIMYTGCGHYIIVRRTIYPSLSQPLTTD